LFDTINPNIILSGYDNSPVLAKYARTKPNKKVILVQTALRDTIGSFPNETELPVYFSYGDAESELLNKLRVRCKELIPIGSVKMGIAIETLPNSLFDESDLCFISDYRASLEIAGYTELQQAIVHVDKILFEHTCKYAKTNSLSLRVLSKTREPRWQTKEHAYFKNLAQGLQFEFVLANKSEEEFSTYFGLLFSNLIINNCSTLGFEALAANKKVVFGATMASGLIPKWGAEAYFHTMPNTIRIDEPCYNHFSRRLDTLRALTDDNYSQMVLSITNTVMRQTEKQSPQDFIKSYLTSYLNNVTNLG